MSVNIGIVGTGWVVGQHLSALEKIPDVRVKAIAGRNTARARELTAGIGAEVYSEWSAMLAREKLDAVFILLPPHLHGELEKACAQAVGAVLVEKPVAMDLETAQEIEEVFVSAGTLVSAAYMNRYRASVARLKKFFSSTDSLPVTVNGWWINQTPPPLWWRIAAESGGQFVEQCTHLVDLARWICGEITEVSAFSTRGFIQELDQYSVDDAMTVNVRFASGALGNFTTGCHPLSSFRGASGVGLSLSSRKGQGDLRGWGMEMKLSTEKTEEKLAPEDNIFEIEDRAFVRALVEKKPELILSSYPDAVRTLKVTLAANASAVSGSPVKVPLVGK